jgi:DNA-binding transcriptional MerR regulator
MTTRDAAGLLGITPSTLRAWQLRYGFPTTQLSPVGRRQFARDELLALQAALSSHLSVTAAIHHARAETRAASQPPSKRPLSSATHRRTRRAHYHVMQKKARR